MNVSGLPLHKTNRKFFVLSKFLSTRLPQQIKNKFFNFQGNFSWSNFCVLEPCTLPLPVASQDLYTKNFSHHSLIKSAKIFVTRVSAVGRRKVLNFIKELKIRSSNRNSKKIFAFWPQWRCDSRFFACGFVKKTLLRDKILLYNGQYGCPTPYI